MDLKSVPKLSYSVLILGIGMLDPEFFAKERAGRVDPATTPLALVRFLLLLYVTYYLYNKLVKNTRLEAVLRYGVWALICWLLIYLSSLVVYFLPPDLPFIFHFMNFSWFSNFCYITNHEEFTYYTYLNGSVGSCTLLTHIYNYKIGYWMYLNRGTVNLHYLNTSIGTLTVLLWCLLGFFDIEDWFLLSAKLFFALPMFLLLPDDLFPFKSPEVGTSYSIYILKGLMSWQGHYLRELKRQSQEIVELPDEIAANVDQQLVEFLLYLLDEFSYVLF
jgi:hypothetical protein